MPRLTAQARRVRNFGCCSVRNTATANKAIGHKPSALTLLNAANPSASPKHDHAQHRKTLPHHAHRKPQHHPRRAVVAGRTADENELRQERHKRRRQNGWRRPIRKNLQRQSIRGVHRQHAETQRHQSRQLRRARRARKREHVAGRMHEYILVVVLRFTSFETEKRDYASSACGGRWYPARSRAPTTRPACNTAEVGCSPARGASSLIACGAVGVAPPVDQTLDVSEVPHLVGLLEKGRGKTVRHPQHDKGDRHHANVESRAMSLIISPALCPAAHSSR